MDHHPFLAEAFCYQMASFKLKKHFALPALSNRKHMEIGEQIANTNNNRSAELTVIHTTAPK